MPLRTRRTTAFQRDRQKQVRERTYASNESEANRAQARLTETQTAKQKRDWLEQKRLRDQEALAARGKGGPVLSAVRRSRTGGVQAIAPQQPEPKGKRTWARPKGGRGHGPLLSAVRRTPEGMLTQEAYQQSQVWPDETRFTQYPRLKSMSKFSGSSRYYPWPDENRYLYGVGSPLTLAPAPAGGGTGGAGGGATGYSPYGGRGGYGGYGGGGYPSDTGPGYGAQRYSYLPDWLARMAQWNI